MLGSLDALDENQRFVVLLCPPFKGHGVTGFRASGIRVSDSSIYSTSTMQGVRGLAVQLLRIFSVAFKTVVTQPCGYKGLDCQV